MWITLFPAVIGLVGVFIGAAVTTGAQYWLAKRAEAVAAEKDRVARANQLRTAVRLIANEFSVAKAAATMLVEKKRWAPKKVQFPLDAWQSDKGVLALELPLADWFAVRTTALAVEFFRNFAPASRSSDAADDASVEDGRSILKQINAGLEALQPHMMDRPR